MYNALLILLASQQNENDPGGALVDTATGGIRNACNDRARGEFDSLEASLAYAAMHSISDLTTFCRKTTGDVPPKLVVSPSLPFTMCDESIFHALGIIDDSCGLQDVSLRTCPGALLTYG
jgi:hypothetical protein